MDTEYVIKNCSEFQQVSRDGVIQLDCPCHEELSEEGGEIKKKTERNENIAVCAEARPAVQEPSV